MQFPYNNYLKCLLCINTKVEDALEQIEALGFIPPTIEYIQVMLNTQEQVIREGTRLLNLEADDADETSKTKDRMEAIAEKAGVLSMAKHKLGRGSAQAKKVHNDCFNILGDGHIRDIVEALLLRRIPEQEIAQIVSSTSTLLVETETIILYRYYFWNVDDVSRTDWKQYLEQIPDKRDKYIKAMALYSRPDYVKWKLGAQVDVPYNSMLSDMASSLYFRFTELIRSENMDNVVKAAKLAEVATRVGKELEEVKKDNMNNFAQELQTQLDFLESKPPLLPEETPEVKK